jgi:Fe-S cluster biogenesis protein NfuA
MASSRDDVAHRKRMERMDSLLRTLEQFPDGTVRMQIKEIVQSILDLHGTGIERMLDRIVESRESGQSLIDLLAGDDMIGSLLLLYGLHPLDIESRVRQALDKVGPQLREHDGSAELVEVTHGAVRLRMNGGCDSCSSSAQTLKLAVEEAIYEKAPEVASIEIEEHWNAAPGANGHTRMALPLLRS